MKAPDLSRLQRLEAETAAAHYRLAAMRPRFARLRARHENDTAPRAVSAFQLFQTPPPLAARMVEMAGILPGQSVLEPSAGCGRLLSPIIAARPAHITAVEISPDCSRELFRSFPGVTLKQGDFLAMDLPRFDRIVMNPPFHMRADIRHIVKATKHLAPGGVLIALCMATRHRREALQPLAESWQEIPAGTFSAEGTRVPCYLLKITN